MKRTSLGWFVVGCMALGGLAGCGGSTDQGKTAAPPAQGTTATSQDYQKATKAGQR